MSTIEKKTYIPFMGGRFVMTPAGQFTRDNGEVVVYEDSLKVEGVGQYPVKLTGSLVKNLVATYKANKTFAAFVDTLAEKEIANT